MTRIATAVVLPPEAIALLETVGELAGPDEWREALPTVEALVTPVSIPVGPALLDQAPRLRIVANAGVGYDNFDLAACREHGVILTNTPGVLTEATADIALGLMLSVVRGLPRAERSLRAGEFRGWGFWDHVNGDIAGARVGIFGMGRIGQAFARRAHACGAVIQYHNRSRLPEAIERPLDATWVDWDTLITTSDILSLHAAYTPELRHRIDAEALGRMKRGSFLVNTARGALVDEAALVVALRDGPLAGAGLDVYEREPAIHPGLLELENAVLLPHIGSATPATRTAMALMASRNIVSVLTGQGPLTPVP